MANITLVGEKSIWDLLTNPCEAVNLVVEKVLIVCAYIVVKYYVVCLNTFKNHLSFWWIWNNLPWIWNTPRSPLNFCPSPRSTAHALPSSTSCRPISPGRLPNLALTGQCVTWGKGQGADTFRSRAVTNCIHVSCIHVSWWDLEDMLSKMDIYVAHMLQTINTLKHIVPW